MQSKVNLQSQGPGGGDAVLFAPIRKTLRFQPVAVTRVAQQRIRITETYVVYVGVRPGYSNHNAWFSQGRLQCKNGGTAAVT